MTAYEAYVVFRQVECGSYKLLLDLGHCVQITDSGAHISKVRCPAVLSPGKILAIG